MHNFEWPFSSLVRSETTKLGRKKEIRPLAGTNDVVDLWKPRELACPKEDY
jgi:hypothetical protein